jgi:hypothetical protein
MNPGLCAKADSLARRGVIVPIKECRPSHPPGVSITNTPSTPISTSARRTPPSPQRLRPALPGPGQIAQLPSRTGKRNPSTSGS